MGNTTLDDLFNHILIEFRLGKIANNDQNLNESHGYVNNIETYTLDFINAIEQTLIPQIENGEDVCHETFRKNIFKGIQPFFNQCAIEVTIAKGNRVKYSGGYSARKSFFLKTTIDGTPFYSMIMNINVEAYDADKIIDILKFVFAHELTHAFEDYNRRLHGTSIDDYAIKSKYYNTNRFYNRPNRYEQDILAIVLNRLNKMERNAIIGQLKTELLDIKSSIINSKTAMEAIKQTDAWKKYENIEKNVNAMLVITHQDKDTANNLLQSFNEIMKTNFTDIKSVRTYLINRWTQWRKKFITMASKIAYDVYCQTIIYDDFTNDKIYGTKTTSNK